MVPACLSLPLGQERPGQLHQISHHNLQTAEEKSSGGNKIAGLDVSNDIEPFLAIKLCKNLFVLIIVLMANGYYYKGRISKSCIKLKYMSTETSIKGSSKTKTKTNNTTRHGGILHISALPTGCCPFQWC